MDGVFLSTCQVKGRDGEEVQISHLLFVDDTLLFFQASQDQMTYLCWILMWFEAISGLRIDIDKIELISMGCVEHVEDLATKLGYKVGSLPSSYLGLSLGASLKFVTAWDGVEEMFQKRLAMWNRQYISKEGRITVIRSTLGSLPIYFMFVLSIPRLVRLRLKQV